MSQARPQAWWRQACFFAAQAAEKALKGAIVELGQEPPHTHVLERLLAALPLRALTRMTVTSRYPLDDTPPLDLFDPADAHSAIATAEAVLRWVEQLDQPMGLQP